MKIVVHMVSLLRKVDHTKAVDTDEFDPPQRTLQFMSQIYLAMRQWMKSQTALGNAAY